MNLINSFSIPLFYQLLGRDTEKLNYRLIKDIFHETTIKDACKRTGGGGIRQTATDLELRYDSFKELGELISSVAHQSLFRIGVKEKSISAVNFWANLNDSVAGFHMPHSHTSGNKNIFTGVYFPTTGFQGVTDRIEIEEKYHPPVVKSESIPSPGSLVLLDPLEFVKTTTITSNVERYPYFGNPICFEPQKSLLVVFPIYQPHMTVPNNTNDLLRMSIAFNLCVN